MKTLSKLLATIIGLALLGISQAQAFGHAEEPSKITFYHHDALGSVIATSNENGEMILSEEYQPYGEKIYQAADSNGGNEDWFTGKNYSQELDLSYFGARWYDAKQGRFLSMDPVGVELASIHSFNRYHYANNNPYKYVDPDGNNAVTAFGGLIVESGNFLTGGGFDGAQVLSALSDGYNGVGEGFAASAYQDATEIIPVGKILGFGSKVFKGARSLITNGGGKVVSKRAFWSGPGARKAAEEYARSTGGKTLEMTLTGKALDKITTRGNFKYVKPLWNVASKNFARGAKGPVDVFHSREGVRLKSVWAQSEFPILKNQGNDINYHIVD